MEPGLAGLGMPKLLELVNAYGPDPGFEEAEPYLEAYRVIAAGMRRRRRAVGRLAVGLE